MEYLGGPIGLIAAAAVVAVALCLAVLHFGFHVFRRPKARGRSSDLTRHGRVEVLETTVIDAERKLVLIRCDQIEHLIMVGGPADLVVENDVRKVRGPGDAPAKIPGFEAAASVPAVASPPVREPVPSAHPRPMDTPRTSLRTPAERSPAPVPGRIPARESAASSSAGRLQEPPGRVMEASGRALPRPQAVETQPKRRDLLPSRRTTVVPTQPAGPQHQAASAERGNSRTTRVEPPNSLPAAQIPWSDPDSIENEIVRALRFEPQARPAQTGRRETPTLKAMAESQTTLGDLADRLEEALAREVQSASQPRRIEPTIDDFGFDNPAQVTREETAALQPERTERRELEARQLVDTPAEPERRRESAERREEAPVISLNARRKESADQLEDEMARLLGELTSDNKGR